MSTDCLRCRSKQALIDAALNRAEAEEKRRLDMTKNYLSMKDERDAALKQIAALTARPKEHA